MNSLEKVRKIKEHLVKQAETENASSNGTISTFFSTMTLFDLKKKRQEMIELATRLEVELELQSEKQNKT